MAYPQLEGDKSDPRIPRGYGERRTYDDSFTATFRDDLHRFSHRLRVAERRAVTLYTDTAFAVGRGWEACLEMQRSDNATSIPGIRASDKPSLPCAGCSLCSGGRP